MLWNQLNETEREDLAKLNDKFEMDAIRDGVNRYHKTVAAIDPASKRPEKQVIAAFLEETAKEIAKQQKIIASGKPTTGSPSAWYAPFISIKPERLALLTLSYLLQSPKQVSSIVCREVGDAVRTEVMLDEIREINKQKTAQQRGFTRIETKKLIKNQPKIQKIYKNLNAGGNLKWKLQHKIALGAKLIECAINATGGWAIQVEFIKKNISKGFCVMNDELVKWIHEYHMDLESVRPLKLPMCVPPVLWGFRDKEGMLTLDPTPEIIGGFRILKEEWVTGAKGNHSADYCVSSMNQVFEAVNHIQDTQWKIDKDILDLVNHLLKLNNPDYSNIIPVQPKKPVLPPVPTDKVAKRLWHQDRIQKRSKWYAETSQRISAIKSIDVARQFADLPIWFPHNIDFRGRFYPSASHISPQGNDLSRALLRYEEEKPLGKNGLDMLIVYAAALAGQDKITYPQRLEWFEKTWMPIIKGKKKFDPFDHKVWVDYDSPLQFIQILWEIQAAVNSPDPTKFLSSVSVNIDGSQNGIQHLSALMRDEIGGRSVNLVDSELPQDLYLDVSNKVLDTIVEDNYNDPNGKDPLGNPAPHVLWQPIFMDKKRRRGIVKRPVLAYPYGVTIRGMHDSLIADGHTDGLQGSQYHNANYLANVINESVKGTVIQAAVLMEYLRDITKLLGDNGFAISWTTPFGLPIVQRYVWEEARIIKTCLHSCTFYVPNGIKGINIPAQVRGIVANFIHSLDSSHAGYCCLDMKDEGMNSVQFIHDSIGTHACNIERLHQIIRKTFINMHDITILEDLVSHLEKSTGIKLPPPPQKGKLNLENIRKSRWFFS